mgnify:CR=1 FL=1
MTHPQGRKEIGEAVLVAVLCTAAGAIVEVVAQLLVDRHQQAQQAARKRAKKGKKRRGA